MAYYARKPGLESYRYAKTRKETYCFICGDRINKGQMRYAKEFLSLCEECARCWEKEGGMLGDISRKKVNINPIFLERKNDNQSI